MGDGLQRCSFSIATRPQPPHWNFIAANLSLQMCCASTSGVPTFLPSILIANLYRFWQKNKTFIANIFLSQTIHSFLVHTVRRHQPCRPWIDFRHKFVKRSILKLIFSRLQKPRLNIS